jgi:hypothetical protein
MAVSDGSYKDNFGTSSFIFSGGYLKSRIYGDNCIPGSPEDQSAHRSEVGGIVGMAITLHMLCKMYDITEGKITLGLDGQSALNSTKASWDPHCWKRDFDILWEARKQLAALPPNLKVSFIWVEGHQDSKSYGDRRPSRELPQDLITGLQHHHGSLDKWALLNIAADTRAKAFWDLHRHRLCPNQKFTHERTAVYLHGKKLSNFDLKSLCTAVQEQGIKDHWWAREQRMQDTIIDRPAWDKLWDMIDWTSQGKAFKTLPFSKQRWLTKHASGHCGVGRMLVRYKWQTHSDCP